MKSILILSLVAAMAGFNSACSKSDSSPANPPNEKMIGYWEMTLDQKSSSPNESTAPVSEYENLTPEAETSYWYYVINSAFAFSVQYAGLTDSKTGIKDFNETVINFGNLSKISENEAKLNYNQETIEKARKAGLSEQEIQKLLGDCQIKLVSEKTLEIPCFNVTINGKPFIAKYTRVDAKATQEKIASVKGNLSALNAKTKEVWSSLLGKKLVLINQISTWTDESGKVYHNEQKAEDIKEENQYDNYVTVNLKEIVVKSQDEVLVNGKYKMVPEFGIAKDHSALTVRFFKVQAEGKFSSSGANGVMEVHSDAVSFRHKSRYGKTTSETTYNYKLVQ